MFRFRPVRLALSVLLFLSTFSVPAGAQAIRGEVTDPDGEPLQSVQVTVTSEGLTSFRELLTTDKKGKFLIRFTLPESQYTYDFLFEKVGFQAFKQPITPSPTRTIHETFVMEVGETREVTQHADLGSVISGTTNEAILAFNEGLTAQREGELKEARAKFEAALAVDSELAPAHVALSQVLLDQREYAAAVEAADRALALKVSPAGPLQVKLQALRALGEGEKADAVAAELAEAEVAVVKAKRIYNEGGEAYQAGDQDTALAKFTEAARLDPSLREAHHAIATLQLAKGNADVAAEAAERALELGSDDLATLRVLYDAYDALGRTDELMEIAPRLAAVDPDFGGGKLLEQAAQFWNAGQADKAVALSRQALAIDSTQVKGWYFIGLQHLSNGENAEARQALTTFIEAAPEDPDAAAAKEMLQYIE